MAETEEAETALKPELGAGDVTFKLDGQEVTLQPSLYAFKTLSRQYGGLANVIEKIGLLDIDCIALVVCVGLKKKTLLHEQYAEKVFRTGMGGDKPDGLAPSCAKFIYNLQRGAQPESAGGDDAEDGKTTENP